MVNCQGSQLLSPLRRNKLMIAWLIHPIIKWLIILLFMLSVPLFLVTFWDFSIGFVPLPCLQNNAHVKYYGTRLGWHKKCFDFRTILAISFLAFVSTYFGCIPKTGSFVRQPVQPLFSIEFHFYIFTAGLLR